MQAKRDISIVLITYNHNKFIREAINGILIQDLSNVLEIIIADDASIDNTCSIINEFHFPESCTVRKIFRTENVGMNKNILEALKLAKGEFVALFEGDDYWTDPQKCSKQAQILRKNPDFSFCWHPVTAINTQNYPEGPSVLTFDVALFNHFIPTCSLMYRRNMLNEIPDFLYKAMSLDISIELLLLMQGPAYKLDEVMGVRYKHPKGISSDKEYLKGVFHNRIEIFWNLNSHSRFRYKKLFHKKIYEIAKIELSRAEHQYSFKQRLRQFNFLIITAPSNFEGVLELLRFLLVRFTQWFKFRLVGFKLFFKHD
jgi:glycosyltransferase involved in cell wall biosynthesis